MKVMHVCLVIAAIVVVILAFYIFYLPQKPSQKLQSLVDLCVQACKNAAKTRKLEEGPCLLDPMPEDADWVCDVAHWPRQAIDNQPENQCQSYRNQTSHHFIEVTPDCDFIRAV